MLSNVSSVDGAQSRVNKNISIYLNCIMQHGYIQHLSFKIYLASFTNWVPFY